jgi:hypothetical protein
MRYCSTSQIIDETDSPLAPIHWMGESDSWYHALVLDGRSGFV